MLLLFSALAYYIMASTIDTRISIAGKNSSARTGAHGLTVGDEGGGWWVVRTVGGEGGGWWVVRTVGDEGGGRFLPIWRLSALAPFEPADTQYRTCQ